MTNKNRVKSPPSRIKYGKNHPTVSARLPKEKRDKLMALLVSLGITLPQLLLKFIGEYELKLVPIEEARKKGFLEAKDIYMVSYPCRRCGKPVAITSKHSKDLVSKYMAEHGLGHDKCSR